MTDHEDLTWRLETPYPAGRCMSNGTTVDPACRDAATAIKELVAERDRLVWAVGEHVAKRKEYYDRAEKAEADLAAARKALRYADEEKGISWIPEHAPAIAAVEAEAAFAADDEAELAEVAGKARACEPDDNVSRVYEEAKAVMRAAADNPEPFSEDEYKSCGTCLFDDPASCGQFCVDYNKWQPKPTEDDDCPNCFEGKSDMDHTCPACNGTGKKEKNDEA